MRDPEEHELEDCRVSDCDRLAVRNGLCLGCYQDGAVDKAMDDAKERRIERERGE